jgi:hypothetical protein
VSFSAGPIRDAIRDVLIGAVGSVRVVPEDRMAANVFAGQTDTSQHARGLLNTHRFDVRIARLRNHESSPVAQIGSYRIAEADIVIDVLTVTKTVAQEDERDTVLATIASDMDDAIQALAFPTNVTQSAALEATGIISGMLLGPGGEGVPEWAEVSQDWKAQEIRSRITCSALLRVHQLALDDPEPMHIFGTSLRAWYRADVVSQSSSLVTEWLDNSGHGFSLAPTTAGQTLSVDPTSSIAGMQSLASLGGGFFDAYRVRGLHAVVRDDEPPNVFVVGRFTTLTPATVERVVEAVDALSAVSFAVQTTVAGVYAYAVGSTVVASAVAADTSAHLIQALHDGTSARLRIDDGTVTVSAVAPHSADVATLGIPHASSSAAAFEYFEVAILNAYPTAAQLTAYRQYVVDRYGLVITP